MITPENWERFQKGDKLVPPIDVTPKPEPTAEELKRISDQRDSDAAAALLKKQREDWKAKQAALDGQTKTDFLNLKNEMARQKDILAKLDAAAVAQAKIDDEHIRLEKARLERLEEGNLSMVLSL